MKLTTLSSQPIPTWINDINNRQTDQNQQTKSPDKTSTDRQQKQQKSTAQEKSINLEKQKQIQQLKQRDQEVRQHEMAHKTAGGQYAGNITYTYQEGPDGNRYAVGGTVQMDTKPANKPEKTVKKATIVRKAALAPAEPSAQDLKVASKANKMKLQAQAKLEEQKTAKNQPDQSITSYQQESTKPNRPEYISLTA